jgi:hypothetical protein
MRSLAETYPDETIVQVPLAQAETVHVSFSEKIFVLLEVFGESYQ